MFFSSVCLLAVLMEDSRKKQLGNVQQRQHGRRDLVAFIVYRRREKGLREVRTE